ncbi:hypothetical protein K1T71_011442 [Dendrolimus kikuchii]|uniref:Uncharacterized protein n=1 Tax=Dendrolimus kikuchii TaxID=765133 RepID=A0ACC1CNU7_9NEOP|nr:hypothetical protein K1T71_011442 [Dendrolimus kikuchii]
MNNDELRNVWKAANNILENDDENPSLPAACNKIANLISFTNNNKRRRLSLRSAAQLCNGSAKMYSMEVKKLLTDITKLDKDIWTRRRRETTVIVSDQLSETPGRSLSPIISHPARRTNIFSPEFTALEDSSQTSLVGTIQWSTDISRSVHSASKRESDREDSERERSPIIPARRIRQRSPELSRFPGASKRKSELGTSERPSLSQTSTGRIQQRTAELSRSYSVVSVRRSERETLKRPRLSQTSSSSIQLRTPELSRSGRNGSIRRRAQWSAERPRSTHDSATPRGEYQRESNISSVYTSQERVTRQGEVRSESPHVILDGCVVSARARGEE